MLGTMSSNVSPAWWSRNVVCMRGSAAAGRSCAEKSGAMWAMAGSNQQVVCLQDKGECFGVLGGGTRGGGPETLEIEAAFPSPMRSMVRTGVHLDGSWLKVPFSQSQIWIAVARARRDWGSDLK